MRLNDDDLGRLQNHMNQFWTRDCPICGTRAWSTKGELTIVPLAGASDGRGFPSVPVRCESCGFLVGIDPFSAGLDLSSYGFSAST